MTNRVILREVGLRDGLQWCGRSCRRRLNWNGAGYRWIEQLLSKWYYLLALIGADIGGRA